MFRLSGTPRRCLQLGLLVAVVLFGASAAVAHEGSAIITIETANDRVDGTEYTIRAVWTNDGHAAVDATVTATPVDPNGATGTPIPLDERDDDGRYGGFVPMPTPGRWTVRFTIVEPTGTAEAFRDVIAQTTTTVPEEEPPTTQPSESGYEADAGNVAAIFIVIGLMVAVFAVAWLMHHQSKKAKAS